MPLSQAVSPATADPGGLIGHTLGGRYLVGGLVAEGGMATVYRATRTDTGEAVAVKVMHPHLTRDRGFARRFQREALIAGRLTHPNIVRVVDHGATDQLYFLVMEMLDGEDIFDVLRHKKRLDAAVARRIVAEICDALAEAHGEGIVHRDLKPENVFLTRAGEGEVRVKVLDFGVAKMMLADERPPGESEPVLTAMGAILGTPEYISPEMCRGEVVGPRADLYACGVLLYALVTGRPPFVTPNPIDVTIKHIHEAPVPPSQLVPDLDPALDAVILKALAKKPQERQASAAVLAADLRALGPTPPLPASLLRARAPAPLPRHVAEAATLALPPGSGPADAPPPPPAVIAPAPPPAAAPAPPARAPVAVAAPPPAPAPAIAAPLVSQEAPGPPTTKRPPAPAAAGSLARVVLAAVVLALTFLAGVAVGRWSAG
jgi:serine/threonine-protein kinase